MKTIYVFQQVIVLFSVIGVGYFSSKRGIIDENMSKGLSDFIVIITMPFLIISSFKSVYSQNMIAVMIKLFILGLGMLVISTFLSQLFNSKFNSEKKCVAVFSGIFSNCGFIGFPILSIVYGDMGIVYAALFNVIYNVVVWTYGVKLMSWKTNKKISFKVLLNSNIIAVFIGIILMVFSVKLPGPVLNFCSLVGNMTTPLSMIIIGTMLANVQLKKIFKDISIYYISVQRLVIFPFLIYILLSILRVEPIYKNIITLLEAMPVASLCPILAQSYDENYKYASEVVLISTIIAIITIPLVILLLGI